jgi:hypothetical protein
MAGFEGARQPLTAAIRIQKAIEQMKARGVNDDYCPRCHEFDWNVDLLEIPANSAMSRSLNFTSITGFPPIGQGSQTIPAPLPPQPTGTLSVLSIVCKVCGYTIFHSMNVLESKAR